MIHSHKIMHIFHPVNMHVCVKMRMCVCLKIFIINNIYNGKKKLYFSNAEQQGKHYIVSLTPFKD